MLWNSLVVQNLQNYFYNTNNILFYYLPTYHSINLIAIKSILKNKRPMPNRVSWNKKYQCLINQHLL